MNNTMTATMTLPKDGRLGIDQMRDAAMLYSVMFWDAAVNGRIPEYIEFSQKCRAAGFRFTTSPCGWEEKKDWLEMMDNWGYPICPICESSGFAFDNDYGYVYCICQVLGRKSSLQSRVTEWGTPYGKKDFDLDLNLPPINRAGKMINSSSLVKIAIDKCKKFVEMPDKWMVLSGTTGTGKSHLLQAIATHLNPLALYVVSSDFESRLRDYLNCENYKIGEYMQALKNHPILLFDDLGLEYMSPWIHAKFDTLIDERSWDAHWFDRLTVAATNITQKDLNDVLMRNGAARSASRLKQYSRVDWIVLDGIDYREKRA